MHPHHHLVVYSMHPQPFACRSVYGSLPQHSFSIIPIFSYNSYPNYFPLLWPTNWCVVLLSNALCDDESLRREIRILRRHLFLLKKLEVFYLLSWSWYCNFSMSQSLSCLKSLTC